MAEEIIEAKHPVRLFILGAGFSAPSGAPVMSNFFNESRKLYARDPVKFSAFEDVYSFQNKMGGAQRRLNIDLDNIETLYGLAEWGKGVLDRGLETFESFNRLISKTLSNKIDLNSRSILRDYYANTEYSDVSFNWESEQNLGKRFPKISVYERFLKTIWEDSIRDKKTTVFLSLNYDLILERSLKKLEIKFEVLGLDEAQTVALDCDKFYILKPHGSLDWEVSGSNICNTGKELEEPIIIPPSWLKISHSDTIIDRVIKNIWKLGIGVINKTNELYILGFSLPDTDQYIRSLISFGLASNVNLTELSIIDRSEETLEKWIKLLTKFTSYEDYKKSSNHNFVYAYEKEMVSALHEMDWMNLKFKVLGY